MDFKNGYSEKYYLLRCKDVRTAVENGFFKNGFEHFSKFGSKEGRDGGEVFNSEYYLKSNPDVAGAVGAGAFSAFEHFLKYGSSEGRTPFAEYNPSLYLAKNLDVAAAVANGSVKSAWEHFTNYGEAEGRQGFNKIPVTYGTKGGDFINESVANKGGLILGDSGNDFINISVIDLGFYRFALPVSSKIYGNQGADTFSFNTNVNANETILGHNGNYNTAIMDYSQIEGDKIRISSNIANNFSDILSVMNQNAKGEATFNIGGVANNSYDVITLEGVSASQVNAAMFEFV